MRTFRKVLGWTISILVLAAVVALGVAEEVLADRLDLTDAAAWGIIAGIGVLFLAVAGSVVVTALRPQERRARRAARELDREKRRKLESFELE
ncbi:MAG TPA: hypothetical protein VF062_04770 [Candidatus Limnocylindrales bacterium]